MPQNEMTIRIEAGSDLDHLLEVVEDTDVVLERDGEFYRLLRISGSVEDAPNEQPPEPERILEIIGLGASKDITNIARQKHQYLADATDHREE